jgi:hypothetical protein
MRKHRAITATLALAGVLAALVLVLVPTALAGDGNLPTISSYTNDKGNKISSTGWGRPVFVNGDRPVTAVTGLRLRRG